MYEVSGFGGEVFLVADPAPFAVYLDDCGDGWDWRCPDPSVSWWQTAAVEALNGSWRLLEPERVFAGRVSLPRSCGGLQVRARGVCRPLTLACRSERWRLRVEAHLVPPSLGHAASVKHGRMSATLTGLDLQSGLRGFLAEAPTLVRLDTRAGCYQAVGEISDNGDHLFVNFTEGVAHGPR